MSSNAWPLELHSLRARTSRRVRPLAIGAAVVGGNLILLLALHHGTRMAVLFALLPALALALAGLLKSDGTILLVAALILPITSAQFTAPLPFPGPFTLWSSDVVLGLAVLSWLATRVLGPKRPAARRAATVPNPAASWPFVLFALALAFATVRGLANSGTAGVVQPSRLVLYAGIAVVIIRLDPRKAYRGIVIAFYLGTVWMLLNAAYYLATGTSQTDQVGLSTGGARILSGTVAEYLALAFLLALLNLQVDTSATRRAIHITIAALAGVGMILGYTRAVFIPVALVLPLIVFRRSILQPLFGVVPLVLPIFIVGAVLLMRAQPTIVPTFIDRISVSPTGDQNVAWRLKTDAAIWPQVSQSPWVGVGFGRGAYITWTDENGFQWREWATQEGHNFWLWLLAAGGVSLLGAFALLLLGQVRAARRRLRETAEPYERSLMVWSSSALVVLLLTAFASPVGALQMLTMWALLILPWVGTARSRENRADAPEAACA